MQLCRADEAELFSKRAQDMYKQFRDKAAISRSMTVGYSMEFALSFILYIPRFHVFIEIETTMSQVEKMEQAAQGRVWTGDDAASLGLVDAIGGLSRAVAIAKKKANIPLDRKVYIYYKIATYVYHTDLLLQALFGMRSATR